MNKKWYKSKTMWFNAVAAALTAFEAVTGMLQPFLPVNFYVAMSVGLPVVNAILRTFTYGQLYSRGNSKDEDHSDRKF